MKSRRTRFLFLSLSLLTTAIIQTVYADEDIMVLDEVVVSGSRTATKLSDTPMSIGVVDEDALQRDKPKLMGDAINRMSWVDLGNEQHAMGIRQPNSTSCRITQSARAPSTRLARPGITALSITTMSVRWGWIANTSRSSAFLLHA